MSLKNFSTILTFGVMAAALAIAASILPSSSEPEQNSNIDYYEPVDEVNLGREKPSAPVIENQDALEELIAKLTPGNSPTKVQRTPIARSTSSNNNNYDPVQTTNPATNQDEFMAMLETANPELSASSPSFLTETIVDESIEAEQKVKADENLRSSAVAEGDLTGCNQISSELVADECRASIYFEEAVAEKNLAKCDLIPIRDLKLRCQNYVSLMLANAQQE